MSFGYVLPGMTSFLGRGCLCCMCENCLIRCETGAESWVIAFCVCVCVCENDSRAVYVRLCGRTGVI